MIQVYAPTADSEEKTIEQLYEDIKEVMRKVRRDGIVRILEDFNTKVGEGEDGSAVGRYELGERNERGDRLVEFAEQHEMII